MSTSATPEATFWPAAMTAGHERLRRIAAWASVGMFLVWIGFSILAFIVNLDQRSLLRRAQNDPFSVSFEEARDSDARAELLNHTLLVLIAVTAACFITWMYLEYRRADRAGAITRFGTGWAIGAWFVPFLNWFRPYQVMEDVWDATAGRNRNRVLLGTWWGFYLASLLVAAAAGSGESRTLDDLLRQNGFYIARAVLTLVAAVLAALVVRAVLLHPASVPSGAETEV